MSIEDDRVTMTGRAEHGDASDYTACDLSGQDIAMGVSVRLLMDALSAMREDTAILDIGNPLDPMLLRDDDSKDSLQVVMPMRLD